MKIEHYKTICRTPALALAVRAWHELLKASLCDEVIMLNWNDESLVAFNEHDIPVGILTFQHLDWRGDIQISLGFVLEECRGQGIYSALWNALIDQAYSRNIKYITGSTAIKNIPMRAVAQRHGRLERGVIINFEVPPKQ